MSTRNKQLSYWVDSETLNKIDNSIELANVKTRSEFAYQAVLFYLGYLNQESIDDFLIPVVSKVVKNQLVYSEKRICEMLYDVAVETAIISNIISARFDVDVDDMDRLRDMCQRMVSSSNGVINFERAYRFQNGK